MHYRCPDVQAKVLLDKPGIGPESPEPPGAQGEVTNISMVEVPIVFDFVDGSFCCAIFHQKRFMKLCAIDWPVLVVIASTFAFGALLLLLPLHERVLSHCDVDVGFDQLDKLRGQLVHMAAGPSPIAVAEA